MADVLAADNEDSRGSVIEIEAPKKPEPLFIDLADEEVVINVKTSLPNSKPGSIDSFDDQCNNGTDEKNGGAGDGKEKKLKVEDKKEAGDDERAEETHKEVNRTEDKAVVTVTKNDEAGKEEEERENEKNEKIENEKVIKEGNENKGDVKEAKEKEEEEKIDNKDDDEGDKDGEETDKEKKSEKDGKKSEAGENAKDEKGVESQGEKIGQIKQEVEDKQLDQDKRDNQTQEGSSGSDPKATASLGSDSKTPVPLMSKLDIKPSFSSNEYTAFPLMSTMSSTASFNCDPLPSNSFSRYTPASNSLTAELRNAFANNFNANFQSTYSPGPQSFYPRKRFSYMAPKRPRMDDTEKHHPNNWTPEMVKYYDEDWNNEEFNVEKLQSQMNKDPSLWQISSRDVAYWKAKDKKPEPRCYNCLDYGHESYNCKKEKKPPKCHMCGLPGHIAYKCPHSVCLNCGTSTTGYVTKCINCKFGLDKVCERCNLTGHIYSECTDHWRLYHSTIGTKRVNEPREEIYKPTRNRWCCNCGRQGHLQVDCGYIAKNPEFSDTLPFVSSYVKAFTRGSQLCYGYEDPANNGRLKIDAADNIMTNPSQKHNYYRKTSQVRNRMRAIKRETMRNERERNIDRRRHPAGGFNRFSIF